MNILLHLLISPYAIARIGLTGFATLLASQAGIWFENSMFGEIAVFYAIAYGVAIVAKGGGDAVFTRTLAAGADHTLALSAYLSASMSRLILAIVPAGAIGVWQFNYGLLEITAVCALSVVIVMGNALRISVSPNYQLGYDSSTVTIVAILFTTVFAAPIWISGMCLAVVLAILQLFALAKEKSLKLHPSAPTKVSSGPYLMSETSYFLLGFAAPGLIALLADMELVGALRSIERLAFAGTFALFIMNNRLFYDFSHGTQTLGSILEYFRRYSLPSTLFYLIVITILSAVAALGLVPNIAAQLTAFLLYAFAYFVSVACGPVSGALNFLGEDRFVMMSSLFGAAIVILLLIFAVATQSPMAIVFGSAAGLAVTNLLQIVRLFIRLKS